MTIVAVLVALAAAATFSVAIPLEHRAADQAPSDGRLSAKGLGAFVRATLRNRWWLMGMALNALGFGLHAFALYEGRLAVVQPLLVANLVFALPVNHRMRRESVTGRELVLAGALAAALTTFLLVATVGVPTNTQPADPGPAIVAAALVVLVAGALAAAARRAGRSAASALFGVATGIFFAVTASLIKACTGLLAGGPVSLLTSWQLYGLLIAGPIGLLLNQLAYQAGPLSSSLPAITVVDPLVAILIGVLVYDENLRHTPLAVVVETVCLGGMAVAGIALGRLEALPRTAVAPSAGADAPVGERRPTP